MKRALVTALTLSMFFGMTACGTQEERIQTEKTVRDMMITWSTDAEEKPTEEMTDLTEDVMLSLLQDSYKKTRKFEKLDFDVVGMEQQDGKINLYFNLDTAYREYIEGENPAVPLMLGEEQHFEIPMRLSAEEAEGKIVLESIEIAARFGKEIKGGFNECSIDEYLPAFGAKQDPETKEYYVDLDTITGTLSVAADGDLLIQRMLWVNETHGYSDNGFFLIDLHEGFSNYIDKDCDVTYFADASTVKSMPIDEFVAHGYMNDRIFDFTAEMIDSPNYPWKVAVIVERYRP